MANCRAVFAVLMFVLHCGCADRTPSYVPTPSQAEQALRNGLDAWRNGLPPDQPLDGKPVVQVVDAGRKPGQQLESYRVLGETRGPTGRTFVVVLQLSQPEEVVKTQYIVVGIDPLWVFRQADYELLVHWDHHMPETEAAPEP